MWKKYATPLRIEVAASSGLLLATSLAALCALASVLWVATLYPLLFLAVLPLTALIHQESKLTVRLRAPKSITAIVWEADMQCSLHLFDGSHVRADLLPFWYASRHFVILHFTDRDNRRRSCVLGRDALEPDDYRRLRVRLRLTSPG